MGRGRCQPHKLPDDNEKKKAERLHCKRRFKERWDIDLTDEIRDMLEHQIRTGDSNFIRHESNRVSIHEVYYDYNFYRVVYDKMREAMITVLPKIKAKKKKGLKKKNPKRFKGE